MFTLHFRIFELPQFFDGRKCIARFFHWSLESVIAADYCTCLCVSLRHKLHSIGGDGCNPTSGDINHLNHWNNWYWSFSIKPQHRDVWSIFLEHSGFSYMAVILLCQSMLGGRETMMFVWEAAMRSSHPWNSEPSPAIRSPIMIWLVHFTVCLGYWNHVGQRCSNHP